jgi:hypothetical protein
MKFVTSNKVTDGSGRALYMQHCILNASALTGSDVWHELGSINPLNQQHPCPPPPLLPENSVRNTTHHVPCMLWGSYATLQGRTSVFWLLCHHKCFLQQRLRAKGETFGWVLTADCMRPSHSFISRLYYIINQSYLCLGCFIN